MPPYEIRQDPDGTWCVYDTVDGSVAWVKGVPQRGMQLDDADDLADLLNWQHRKGNEGTT